MELKISEKMHEDLMYAANFYGNAYGKLCYSNRRTEDALLRRGLITYDITEDNYPVITPKGWAYLASKGFNRRAEDPGRLSLEEAREQAYAECPCDDHLLPARENDCCDHAPMYHGARGCDECGCTEPRITNTEEIHVTKANSKITPEMIEALRWLRKRSSVDALARAHFNVLDNAGVFAPIDEATGYDVDPETERVSKCTCPKTVPQVEAGNHFPNCPGDPAEWGDMAYTTAPKPTAADNIRSAINLKF